MALEHSETIEPYTNKRFGQFYPEVISSYITTGKELVRAIGILSIEAPVAMMRKHQIGKIIGNGSVTISDARNIVRNI